MKNGILYMVRLMRVKQWVKNTFIFFPLIFAGLLSDAKLLMDCLVTFIGFCLISSSVYVLNDLIDAKRDRLHPKKSKRPLAQGKVNRPFVIILIGTLAIIGLFMCAYVHEVVFYFAFLYVLLHLLYNAFAKKIIIIDVMFVAAGFQIRIWAGSLAAGVLPSAWLQMCVFLLALYLGFTKRRYEISALKSNASQHRGVLAHYTSYLLDQIIIICSTLTVVFYGLYVLSSDIVARIGSNNIIYSMVFVIYGVFRYLYLVHVKKMGDDPGDVLFSDMPLLIDILLWVLFVGALLYL